MQHHRPGHHTGDNRGRTQTNQNVAARAHHDRVLTRKAVVSRDTTRRRQRSPSHHTMPLRWGCSAET
jgi:hypothetical protein